MNIKKIFIFIVLIIANDECWATSLQQFPPNLSPTTKVGDGAHGRGGNQALVDTILCMYQIHNVQ